MIVSFKSTSQAATNIAKGFACCLRKLQGYVGGTASIQYFIHVFDAYAVPANGTAPLRSLQVIGMDGYSYSFEDGEIQTSTALCFALSSTEETYTAVVDGAKATWEGEVNQVEPTPITVVGDLTTGVGNLQVWSEAAGATTPARLTRLEIKNNSGAAAYPVVTFTDTFVLTDDVVVAPYGSTQTSGIANGATKVFSFGRGSHRLKNDAGTIRMGCTIRMSSTPTRPYVEVAGTSFNIRATYVTTP